MLSYYLLLLLHTNKNHHHHLCSGVTQERLQARMTLETRTFTYGASGQKVVVTAQRQMNIQHVPHFLRKHPALLAFWFKTCTIHPTMDIWIVHDIRLLHPFPQVRSVRNPRHWSLTPFARVATDLRHRFGAFMARRYQFAWNHEDPFLWRLVSTGERRRGKTRFLREKDLLEHEGIAPPNAWDEWLTLLAQPRVALEEMARHATIDTQNVSPPRPPPSGSILGHPTLSERSDPAAMASRLARARDAILLRYMQRAKDLPPAEWRKVLPPVVPASEFFAVFGWRKMADLLRSPM